MNRKIDDHGYTYKLRLLKDQESGTIRIAAAKDENSEPGEDTREVTVWTAFSELPHPLILFIMLMNMRSFVPNHVSRLHVLQPPRHSRHLQHPSILLFQQLQYAVTEAV